MRTFNNLLIITCFIIASSCKKQIESNKVESVITASPAATSSVCKPEVLATFGTSFIDGITVTDVWDNIMQRWFIAGKVAYLKADLGFGFKTPGMPPRIKWGVAFYSNDSVYLSDVGHFGLVILKVKMDNLGRPVVSEYLDPDGRETANYTYNASGNLATVSFQRGGAVELFTFTYDDKGDLLQAESPATLILISYDYNKPVSGMLGLHGVNAHLKLMEYMDLVEMPLKYQVTSALRISVPAGDRIDWGYSDIRLLGGSLVYSFKCSTYIFPGNTYYVGWTCDGPLSRTKDGALQKEITSLEEFKRRYPDASSFKGN